MIFILWVSAGLATLAGMLELLDGQGRHRRCAARARLPHRSGGSQRPQRRRQSEASQLSRFVPLATREVVPDMRQPRPHGGRTEAVENDPNSPTCDQPVTLSGRSEAV